MASPEVDFAEAGSGPHSAGPVAGARGSEQAAVFDGQQPERGGRLASNILSLGVGQFITWSLTLIWTLVVPRYLGADQMGYLVIGTSVAGMATVVFAFTTRDYLVREMVIKPKLMPRLVSTGFVTRGGALPLGLVLALIYAQAADVAGAGLAVMLLVVAATGIAVMTEVLLSVFQATGRMRNIAVTDVATKGLSSLVGVGLVLAGSGVVAVAAGGLFVALVVLCGALWWVGRLVTLGGRPLPFLPTLSDARPYWSLAVLTVSYVWVDGFFLGILAEPEVAGWYGVAVRLFMTTSFVGGIIATATLPRLVGANIRGSRQLYDAARRPLEIALIAAVALGVGLAVVADDLVIVLFGEEFTNSTVPLIILALGLPLSYFNVLSNQIFVAQGRPRFIVRVLIAAMILNIGLNWWLIPLTEESFGNGAIGAAVSLVAAECLQSGIGLAVHGREIVRRSTWKAVGAAVLGAVLMTMACSSLGESTLLLQAVVGGLVFCSVLLVLRVPTKQESVAFRGVVQSRICQPLARLRNLRGDR